RLDPVLVGVDAYGELVVSLGGVEHSQPRIAGGLEDHVRALLVLGVGQFASLARIVPSRVGDADVIAQDPDGRIYVTRAFLVAGLEPVNQWDVHPADEADGAGFRGVSRDHPDQERSFVLLEHEAGDVRRIGYRVNHYEMELRIILRHLFQDRPLRESDAD